VFTAKIIAQNVEFQLGGKTNAEKFEITDSDGKVIFQLKGNGKIGLGSSVLKNSKMHVQGSINSQGVYKLLGKTVLSIKGSGNTFVGEEAGIINTGVGYNTFTGYRAGYTNSTGYANSFFGYLAGLSNDTGQWNTFIGSASGYNNTTGNYNTYVGEGTGPINTTGNNNTFIGTNAGYYNTTDNNTFIGYTAGYSNTSGGYNTFVGSLAGYSNTTGGIHNDFSGYQTGYSNTEGSRNTFGGSEAGYNNSIGSFNVFIGRWAGKMNISGNNNTYIGSYAGDGSTGTGNVFLGYAAGADETGSNKLYIDNSDTGNPLIWGDFSTDSVRINGDLHVTGDFYVNGSMPSSGGSDSDWTISSSDMYSAVSGNVGIGKSSPSDKLDVDGHINTDNTYKITGKTVLKSNSVGNLFIGKYAGKNTAPSGSDNGQFNTLVGDSAGFSNTIGYKNTFSGYETGFSNISGTSNTFLGMHAGYSNTTANNNVLLGFAAGYLHETGNANVFIGLEAGRNNTAGSRNVFIGRYAGHSETGSDKLFIENAITSSPLIWGDFSADRVVINGNSSDNTNNRTFFVNGAAGGTGAWNNDSDCRMKKNIETIGQALQKVQNLRGVNFEWKDTEHHEAGLQMGFIAQEVEEVIPEVVSNGGDSYSMQYSLLTALLVEAVKEQQQIIKDLKQRVQTLENQQQLAEVR
jgi:hypothetical protein